MTAIIEAHGLTKRFGEVEALAGLDLVAESGHVTALLGPNGAGQDDLRQRRRHAPPPRLGRAAVSPVSTSPPNRAGFARSSGSPASTRRSSPR